MYHTNHSNPQYAANGNVYRTNRTDHEKESFRNFWELNMKCFQEMYLDRTSTQTQQSSNRFSPTTIAGANSLTPSTLSPLLQATDNTVMQHSHLGTVGASVSAAAAAHGSHFQAATGPNMHQLLQQQQLTAAAVAQHQLALAAGRGSNQQQDEISKSLKMFAMLTAYKTGTEPTPNLQAPVDDIMKDFACNGHICDELNRYHQYQAALQFANSGINNRVALNVNSAGNNIINNTAPSIQHFNVNMNDVRTNIWKMLPSHVQQTQVASTNFDYNSNKKSLQKQRSNSSKIEKYSSPKHCVFCENNNEPEAVVQSHSVRDTLGRVLCPKLRTYVCPICKASGDMAHTIKYCPQKPIVTMEDAIKAESYRLAKGTFYKQQMKI